MQRLEEQEADEQELRAFAASEVAPHAHAIDREQRIPAEVVRTLAEAGMFRSGFPESFGGLGGEPEQAAIRHGLMHEALGAASASVEGMVNVHHMAGSALARWGTREQKQFWLPRMTSGEVLGGLAITEPNVGSDAASVETTARRVGSEYLLNGAKTWITCGQSAGLFVLLARCAEGPAAFLVPRGAQGLRFEPIDDMLGCRGYMLATLRLEECTLPAESLLGKPPFGLTHVAATGLEWGRYNLAWGCVGLGRACLESALDFTRRRRQFGNALSEFQLIQQMICRMMTDVEAARLLCWRAGSLRGRKHPAAVKETTMAKYFASQMANRVAYDAVQVHGALGCGPDSAVARAMRDARVMEIIEGTTQVLEMAIARYGYQERAMQEQG
jgi:hypothetical protein